VREVYHTRARANTHTHTSTSIWRPSLSWARSRRFLAITSFLRRSCIFTDTTNIYIRIHHVYITQILLVYKTYPSKLITSCDAPRERLGTNTYKLKCHARHIPPIDSFLDVPCRQHFSVHSTYWKHLPFRRVTFCAAAYCLFISSLFFFFLAFSMVVLTKSKSFLCKYK
jgi:hypothetical protein